MNTNVSAQPARDGFKALSDAEKRWFLIPDYRSAACPTHERPVQSRLLVT